MKPLVSKLKSRNPKAQKSEAKAAAPIRKDGGGAAAASMSQGCFEMKPFIATLVVLTLVIALYQLLPPTPSDPNKHIFPAYSNAAALFVQMGAYCGGPFVVVGLTQISVVDRDILACVSAVSRDIPAY